MDTGCLYFNDFRERLWCRFGGGLGFRGVVAEVGGGDLEDVGEEACSFEVHAVGGEQGGELSEGVLDGGAGEIGGDFEGLVL